MEMMNGYFSVINPLYTAPEDEKKSALILDKNTKANLKEKQQVDIMKLNKLTIDGVSPQIEKLKVGDVIFINSARFNAAPDFIQDGKHYVFFREGDVIFRH